jgi:hypothetical protein
MLSSVQNKANSWRCRVGRSPGDGGRGSCTNKANSKKRRGPAHDLLGALRHTKPICHRRAGKTIAKARGLDAATPKGDKRAKQSQFAPKCQTGQVLLGKGFMVIYTSTGPQQNKANSQRCRVERGPGNGGRAVLYKQSQFAAEPQVGGWTARSMRAKRTQFARQGRAGRGQRGMGRGANARNKPNVSGRSGRPSLAPSTLRPRPCHADCAKQSQLGPVVRGGGPGYNGAGQDIVKFRI